MSRVQVAAAILGQLARGPASATQIAQLLGVSQSTLSRTLRTLEDSGQVMRLLGARKLARYGLRRPVGTVGSQWPLYRIAADGTPGQIATMHALERDHYYIDGGPERIAGLFEGIPYFLQDARPGGFLGRAVPAAHPQLALPARVTDWTDVHFLIFATRCGSESVGDLILGAEALDRHLANSHRHQVVSLEDRVNSYPVLAQAAMEGSPPGSPAPGEHPKFTIRIARGEHLTHALVKFSPPRTTLLGIRWADLLIAEHHAGQILSQHSILAATSELLEYGAQVFLESSRFDRVGAEGRLGVVSLHSLDRSYYGELDRWSAAAQRLLADELLSEQDAETITLLDVFGNLIANPDRHFGNITLFDRYAGRFELAPIYDMLPMLFAPQDLQLIERAFEPAGPSSATLAVWPRAFEMAVRYWESLNADARISTDFRSRCQRCLDALRLMPQRGLRRTASPSNTV